jgi:hypothetical protein
MGTTHVRDPRKIQAGLAATFNAAGDWRHLRYTRSNLGRQGVREARRRGWLDRDGHLTARGLREADDHALMALAGGGAMTLPKMGAGASAKLAKRGARPRGRHARARDARRGKVGPGSIDPGTAPLAAAAAGALAASRGVGRGADR